MKRKLLSGLLCLSLSPDGSAPTTQAPDSLTFNDDYTALTNTYRFTEQLWNGNTLLHDKGTYICLELVNGTKNEKYMSK